MSVFSTNFTNLCNANGLSPTSAAVGAGLSRSAPTTWKKRQSDPGAESMLMIADFFGVSVSYLLTEHPADEPVPLIERKTMWQDVVEADEIDILHTIIAEKKAENGAEKNKPATDESDKLNARPNENTNKRSITEMDVEEFNRLKQDLAEVIDILKIANGVKKDLDDEDAFLIDSIRSLKSEDQIIVRRIIRDVILSFQEKGEGV